MAESPAPRLLTVPPDSPPTRLDAWLSATFPDISRASFQRYINAGRVSLNDETPRCRSTVRPGDRIAVDFPPPPSGELIGQDLALPVIHEDADLLVIDKPTGMAVHPGAGCREGTVVNALLGRGTALSDTRGEERPGIVHRLDKGTSGLLLIAKNNYAHERVAVQFRERTIKKWYQAIVCGAVAAPGEVDEPLARSRFHRKKMAVDPQGKAARTRYRPLALAGKYTWLELRIFTGRTHQIRVHMAHRGHPVLCDGLYSRRSVLRRRDLPGRLPEPQAPVCERLALHAARLELRHPRSGAELRFEAPWPQELGRAFGALCDAYGAPRPGSR